MREHTRTDQPAIDVTQATVVSGADEAARAVLALTGLRRACRLLGRDPGSQRTVVLGSGRVAALTAALLDRAGVRHLTVLDAGSGPAALALGAREAEVLVDLSGQEPEELLGAMSETPVVLSLPGQGRARRGATQRAAVYATPGSTPARSALGEGLEEAGQLTPEARGRRRVCAAAAGLVLRLGPARPGGPPADRGGRPGRRRQRAAGDVGGLTQVNPASTSSAAARP